MKSVAAIGLLTALCFAGCGTTPLSTQELRSQATRVCAAAHKQTDRIAPPAAPAGGATFLARGIAVLDPELKVLRTLHPPRDLAQVYSTALRAFAQKLDALHTASGTLSGGGDPVVAIKTLEQRIAPLQVEEDGAWRALDVPACLNR